MIQLDALLREARDQAKTILAALEEGGHPQTTESSALYLSLVALQKRLSQHGPGPPPRDLADELAELAGLCQGKLEPLKPLLERAAQLAGGRPPRLTDTG